MALTHELLPTAQVLHSAVRDGDGDSDGGENFAVVDALAVELEAARRATREEAARGAAAAAGAAQQESHVRRLAAELAAGSASRLEVEEHNRVLQRLVGEMQVHCVVLFSDVFVVQ
jgi:hypothetical protein